MKKGRGESAAEACNFFLRFLNHQLMDFEIVLASIKSTSSVPVLSERQCRGAVAVGEAVLEAHCWRCRGRWRRGSDSDDAEADAIENEFRPQVASLAASPDAEVDDDGRCRTSPKTIVAAPKTIVAASKIADGESTDGV